MQSKHFNFALEHKRINIFCVYSKETRHYLNGGKPVVNSYMALLCMA